MSKNGKTAVLEESAETTGGAARDARFDKPYSAEVVIEGVAHMLMHKYDCAEVESKGAAAKGSKQKKTDNVESYVYRDPETGELCIPASNFKSALVEAARSMQDPRSPRKSARDLVRASLFVTPDLASFGKGKKEWDFLDRRPCVVQRNRITRVRPGMHKGWRLTFVVNVIQPVYVSPDFLEQLVKNAGSFCGIGDFRPDFGRFTIRKFETRAFSDVQ